MDLDAVGRLIRDVADAVITPRFNALHDGDVSEKSPGELVTIADTEAETLLAAGLQELLPGVPVVGEEAASLDPLLHDVLPGAPLAWLVDPLDGTPGFVTGSADHAVMVALLAWGETIASWIYQPQYGALYVAERGSGAYRNGVRLSREPVVGRSLINLRGGVYRNFLDAEVSAAVQANEHRFASLEPLSGCAGVEYPRLVSGGADFLLYWRALPWDHAAGALLLQEAGGVARRIDGRDYHPGQPGRGLLVASDPASWHEVREGLGLARA